MCGIIGLITKETHKNASERRRFFTQALLADQFRGEDATGIITVPHVKKGELAKAWWYKQAAKASHFVTNDLYVKSMQMTSDYKYMVGHNRFGTHGNKDQTPNAHPFIEGAITLVHNGGLHQMHNLPLPKHKLDKEVEVDSHVICHNLAVHSVKEVVAELNGAYVLVWHDARDDSLNIIRNAQRPLAMAKDLDSNTIFFASEASMLLWVAERNNIRLGQIMEPKPGHWLHFTPEGGLKPDVEVLPMYSGGTWQGRGRHASFTNQAGTSTNEYGWRVALPFVQGPSERRTSSPERKPSESEGRQLLPPEQVLLNKRYISMPAALENNLASYSIDPQDTYLFTPSFAQFLDQQGKTYGRVTGVLDTGETAFMHGVLASTYHANCNHDWVVAPLAVLEKESPSGNEMETTLIVRPFKYVVPFGFATRRFYLEDAIEEGTDSRDARVEELVDSIAGEDTVLRGPKGVFIPKAEWMELVKKGCSMCHEKLFPRMDEEIIWMTNGDAVCPDCVDAERVRQWMGIGTGEMS